MALFAGVLSDQPTVSWRSGEFKQPPGKNRNATGGFTLVEIAVVTAILGLLVAIVVPNFNQSRLKTQRDTCIYNLSRIDLAKSNWALEHGRTQNDEPSLEDIQPYFVHETMPVCPAGGEYDLGLVDEAPYCTMEDLGHVYGLDEDADGQGGGAGNRGRRQRGN